MENGYLEEAMENICQDANHVSMEVLILSLPLFMELITLILIHNGGSLQLVLDFFFINICIKYYFICIFIIFK